MLEISMSLTSVPQTVHLSVCLSNLPVFDISQMVCHLMSTYCKDYASNGSAVPNLYCILSQTLDSTLHPIRF